MIIKRWTSINKSIKIKLDNLQQIYNKHNSDGGVDMALANIRENKQFLKSLLMKNVKTDNEGRVLISKNDEWINEKEWDELYDDTQKQ